jgi:hypothetical protein
LQCREPDWSTIFDWDPEQAARSRRKFLTEIAGTGKCRTRSDDVVSQNHGLERMYRPAPRPLMLVSPARAVPLKKDDSASAPQDQHNLI